MRTSRAQVQTFVQRTFRVTPTFARAAPGRPRARAASRNSLRNRDLRLRAAVARRVDRLDREFARARRERDFGAERRSAGYRLEAERRHFRVHACDVERGRAA